MRTEASVSIKHDDIRRYLRKVVTPYGRHVLTGTDDSEILTTGLCTSRASFEECAAALEFVVVRYCSHGVNIEWDSLHALDAMID